MLFEVLKKHKDGKGQHPVITANFILNNPNFDKIAANFKNDVFISSKLITYLNTNIPILSLTPRNSPSDNLLKDNIELGIIKTYYNENNRITAFQEALDIMSPVSQSIKINREKVLKAFKKEQVGELIVTALKKIIANKKHN
jgi:hypothetical protein